MKEFSVIDVCCGSKMMYFDKDAPYVLFQDVRKENDVLCDGRKLIISPDIIGDFTNMPYKNNFFNLVVFDPPHLNAVGDASWLKKKYGRLPTFWKNYLETGFNECWRILSYGGTLIFKWNETQIKLKEVLACFNQKPLFGYTTTHNLKTHWMVFYKNETNSSPL